jgi:hypothetical protein
MNCKDTIRNLISDHDLICTVYPPKIRREQLVNNSDSPLKSRFPAISARELFTVKPLGKTGGEQVARRKNKNKRRDAELTTNGHQGTRQGTRILDREIHQIHEISEITEANRGNGRNRF